MGWCLHWTSPSRERERWWRRGAGVRKKKSRSLGEVSGPSLPKPELKQEPTQGDTDPWSCQGGTSEAHLTGPKETDSFLSIIPSRGHPVSSCGPHPRSPGAPPTGDTPEWIAMPSSRRRHFLLSLFIFLLFVIWSFPGGASGKEPACQCRRLGRCKLDPWVGKIPWRRSGNPLQYSSLEKLMDSAAWRATVHGVQRVGHNLVTDHTRYFVIQLHYPKIFLKYRNKIYSEFMFYKIIKYIFIVLLSKTCHLLQIKFKCLDNWETICHFY